jgi:hypothetical protein
VQVPSMARILAIPAQCVHPGLGAPAWICGPAVAPGLQTAAVCFLACGFRFERENGRVFAMGITPDRWGGVSVLEDQPFVSDSCRLFRDGSLEEAVDAGQAGRSGPGFITIAPDAGHSRPQASGPLSLDPSGITAVLNCPAVRLGHKWDTPFQGAHQHPPLADVLIQK